MKLVAPLFIAWLALTGCAAPSPQALREKPAGKVAFEIDRNYQPVYRAILDRARPCYQGGMITAQMIVQGDLYHDTKSGTVTVALHGALGIDNYIAIDVKAVNDGRTRVETFYVWDNMLTAAQVVEDWANERTSDCRLAKPR
jgi:hypothetical protein